VIVPPVDPELEQQQQDQIRPVQRDDPKFAAGKVAVFQYASVGVFLFLISGFWALQVENPQFYNDQAVRNQIKSLPIIAPRGKFLDRDGRVIVDNHSSYSVILSRESLKMEHLRGIADGLNLEYDELYRRVQRYKSRPKYEDIIIKQELTPAELSFVESHHDPEFYPEMELIHSQPRLYPQNGMAAHVIGYTGEISEQELDNPQYAKYNAGDVIGKFGLERQYNDELMGVNGQRQVMVDNRGNVRKVLGMKEAIPGHDMQLTLDLDLQAVAELTMEGRNGAVVAIDPRTGEILAMVSRPTFDPNKFTARIRAADWKEIAENPAHPLINRAIQAQLAPGSTFKPIVALAGLETGSIDDHFGAHCSGGATFYGRYFKCHEKKGHGGVTLHRGIAVSCDVYFYNVGNKTGIDNIAHYAEELGLSRKTGVDLPQEKDGVMPSSRWKLRNFREKWYAGETISVAIGQGAVTVTPLQLARAYAGIAMGGVVPVPHLLRSQTGKLQPHIVKLDPDNVKKVIDGTYAVVNEGGTGGRARLPNIEVCGKTGTAQLASNEFLKGNKQKNMRDNAWFVGYAPRSAPEIVVVALFENGEHGNFAAPIVRDVLKAYFDKKARLAMQSKAVQPPVIGLQKPAAPVQAQPETPNPEPRTPSSPTPF
jgi:penicillin-binding protein 2